MLKLFLIFVGGGAGSLLRYSLSILLASSSKTLPFATFLANVTACFCVGVFSNMASKNLLSLELRLLLVTGFCGGFSTFSTFSNETLLLLQAGKMGAALLYTVLSLVACLASVWLGYLLTAK